ncbi:MAG: hypothetical protein AB7E81_01080 [Hyphomicrobiaceae bacterium]
MRKAIEIQAEPASEGDLPPALGPYSAHNVTHAHHLSEADAITDARRHIRATDYSIYRHQGISPFYVCC